jgi:hypothetical protein
MKGIALDLGARHRGIQEIQIERGIVTHQHGARAVGIADRSAHFAKDALQRIVFLDGRTQWMMGVNAVDRQRGGFHIRAGEGRHVKAVSLAARQAAVGAHFHQHGGNFQQRIGLGIEAAGFDIHHHGQKAAKARGKGNGRDLRHAASLLKRQAMFSPAR